MATTTSQATGSLAEQRRRRSIGRIVLYVFMTLASLMFMMPFFLMLSSAFKPFAEILRIPPTLLPANPTVNGFVTVVQDAPFFRWFGNSLIVSLSVTGLVLMTSSLAVAEPISSCWTAG